MNGVAGRAVQVLVVIDQVGSTLGDLRPFLSSRRRRRLSEAIFLDVLDAIRESRLVDAIVLATRNPAAVEMARKAGIPVTEALASGNHDASQSDANGLVAIIQGDLPVLEGQDLAFLFGRVGPDRRVLLVPTPGSESLSMVVSRGADAFLADFREGTLASWMDTAAQRRIPAEVFALSAGMRPSNPADLLQMYTGARASRAKGLLKEWHTGQKLRELVEEDR